jgi:hypothetical protein
MIDLINYNAGKALTFSILGKYSSAGDHMEWQIVRSTLKGYIALVKFNRRDEKSSLQISFFKIDHITHFSIGVRL